MVATPDFPPTARTSGLRLADRLAYDRDTVHPILDEALVCHVSFVHDGSPRILPTLHVRIDDTLYLHGSTGSRPMLASRGEALPVCVAATLIDGLVLARSQFHHSANYRSVVVHGDARRVTDDAERNAVLAAIVDKVAAGRSADSRPPSAAELAATALLAVDLREVSAKVRSGGVNEDEPDLDLPHWAGVVPLRLVADWPVPDNSGSQVPLPAYLVDYHRGTPPPRTPWLSAPVMSGDLVRLEPLSLDHVDELFEATADDEVHRHLPWYAPADRDEMASHVAAALRMWHDGERVPFAQIEVATGRVVGTTSYYQPDARLRSVEIGFTSLARRVWGTGINVEAKLLLLRRAFEDLHARRVSWQTDVRNERSQRAIEALGAVREGVLRANRYRADGSDRDSVVYSMTAAEWPNARDLLHHRLAARLPAAPSR